MKMPEKCPRTNARVDCMKSDCNSGIFRRIKQILPLSQPSTNQQLTQTIPKQTQRFPPPRS